MSKAYNPKPLYNTYCVICQEKLGSAPFMASKVRKGVIYIHKSCWEKEQKELKEARQNGRA